VLRVLSVGGGVINSGYRRANLVWPPSPPPPKAERQMKKKNWNKNFRPPPTSLFTFRLVYYTFACIHVYRVYVFTCCSPLVAILFLVCAWIPHRLQSGLNVTEVRVYSAYVQFIIIYRRLLTGRRAIKVIFVYYEFL